MHDWNGLRLSTRTINCLTNYGVRTIEDAKLFLASCTGKRFKAVMNFGKISREELRGELLRHARETGQPIESVPEAPKALNHCEVDLLICVAVNALKLAAHEENTARREGREPCPEMQAIRDLLPNSMLDKLRNIVAQRVRRAA